MSLNNGEQALDFICRTAQGISLMFGSKCETLVHDMTKPGHPIIAIYNNGVSGREVGSTHNIYGNENPHVYTPQKDFVNNMAVNKKGRLIKSSTFNYRGDGFWYALGINFDYTVFDEASKMISELVSVNTDLQCAINHSGCEKLEEIFNSCVAVFDKSIEGLSKSERVRLIGLLSENGVFNFQKSIPFVSEKLGVSRHTVYKYIKEITEKQA